MTHNVSAGVVLSTQSLVMQGVTRAHAGHYVCRAANDQGETASQPVRLRVKCEYCRDCWEGRADTVRHSGQISASGIKI